MEIFKIQKYTNWSSKRLEYIEELFKGEELFTKKYKIDGYTVYVMRNGDIMKILNSSSVMDLTGMYGDDMYDYSKQILKYEPSPETLNSTQIALLLEIHEKFKLGLINEIEFSVKRQFIYDETYYNYRNYYITENGLVMYYFVNNKYFYDKKLLTKFDDRCKKLKLNKSSYQIKNGNLTKCVNYDDSFDKILENVKKYEDKDRYVAYSNSFYELNKVSNQTPYNCDTYDLNIVDREYICLQLPNSEKGYIMNTDNKDISIEKLNEIKIELLKEKELSL